MSNYLNENEHIEVLAADWSQVSSKTAFEALPNPVAYYPFNNASGQDWSGNENHGRAYNVLPSFGKSLGGLLILDSGSRVLVPHSDSLNLSEEFTITGWVYPTSFPRANFNRKMSNLPPKSFHRGTPNLSYLATRLGRWLVQIGSSKFETRPLSQPNPRILKALLAPQNDGAAPSLLCKPNAFGLDVHPQTFKPYCSIVVSGVIHSARAVEPIVRLKWTQLSAVFDGHALRLYVDDALAGIEPISSHARDIIKSDKKESTEAPAKELNRLNDLLLDSLPDDARVKIDASLEPIYIGEFPFDRGVSEAVIDQIRIFRSALTHSQLKTIHSRSGGVAQFLFPREHNMGTANNRDSLILHGGSFVVCDEEKGPCLRLFGGSQWAEIEIRKFIGENDSANPAIEMSREATARSFSIHGWFKFTNLPTSVPWKLFGQDIEGFPIFSLAMGNLGVVSWTLLSDRMSYTVHSQVALPTDEWIFVCGVFDAETCLGQLYIGTKSQGQIAVKGSGPNINWNKQFNIGGPNGYGPDCKVADIAIYPYAIDQVDISIAAELVKNRCAENELGTLEDLIPQEGVHDNHRLPPDIPNCTLITCNRDQIRAWQDFLRAKEAAEGIENVGELDCRLTTCTPAEVQAWQARLLNEREQAQSPEDLLDCSMAECTLEQARAYDRKKSDNFRRNREEPPNMNNCGPLTFCPMNVAEGAAMTQSTEDENGSSGSASSSDDDDDDDDVPEDDTPTTSPDSGTSSPSPSSGTVGGLDDEDVEPVTFTQNSDGSVNVYDSNDEPIDDGIWEVRDDQTSAVGWMQCRNGICRNHVPTESDSGSGQTSGGTTTGSGTSPQNDTSTVENNNPLAGFNSPTAYDTDPSADGRRSAWDVWADTSIPSGVSTNIGGQQSTPNQTPQERDGRSRSRRGIIDPLSVGSIIYPGSGFGTAGPGFTGALPGDIGISSDHGHLVPVVGLRNGIIVNNTIDNLLPPGLSGDQPEGISLSDILGEHFGSGNGIGSEPFPRDKRLANRALTELSARGLGSDKRDGLIPLIHDILKKIIEPSPRTTVEQQNKQLDLAEKVLDFVSGFIPGVNDLRDLYEAITGFNLVTGEKLDGFEWAASVFGIIIGSGQFFRNAADGMLDDIAEAGRHTADELENYSSTFKRLAASADDMELSTLPTRPIKVKNPTSEHGRYQIQVTGSNQEWEIDLGQEVPYDSRSTNIRQWSTDKVIQVDGMLVENGKKYFVEAKYTAYYPNSHFNPDNATYKPGRMVDQMRRYNTLLGRNPNVDGVIMYANDAELGQQIQKYIDNFGWEKFEVRISPLVD